MCVQFFSWYIIRRNKLNLQKEDEKNPRKAVDETLNESVFGYMTWKIKN